MKKLQLLWVCSSYLTPNASVKSHSHEYCHLLCMREGELVFTLNGSEFAMRAGDIVLVPAGVLHEFQNKTAAKAEYYEIKFTLLNRALEQAVLAGKNYISNDSFACHLVEHVADEYLHNRTMSDDSATAALNTLMFHLTSETRIISEGDAPIIDTSDYSPTAKKVIDYLEANYSRNLTLDDVSAGVGISKNYLCNAFKSNTGITILDCLNMIRVRKAAELIVYSDLSLTQVAKMCGYVSTSHFNRVFSRVAGIPPGQCRRAFSFDCLSSGSEQARRNPGTFMYSVLAGKSISPQTINEFELKNR